MNRIIDIFKKHNGYAYLKELKAQGIHTDTIRKLLESETIEKVKPGLYKLVDMPISTEQGMIDVHMAMPRAVICLFSALSYYELTTTVPSTIMVALPRGSKPVKIIYPPIRIFYFSKNNFQFGIKQIRTEHGTFNIFEVEKTIVDCFRYRKKLGGNVALEGLKNYLAKQDYQINKLVDYSKASRMFSIIKPYIEAYIYK